MWNTDPVVLLSPDPVVPLLRGVINLHNGRHTGGSCPPTRKLVELGWGPAHGLREVVAEWKPTWQRS